MHCVRQQSTLLSPSHDGRTVATAVFIYDPATNVIGVNITAFGWEITLFDRLPGFQLKCPAFLRYFELIVQCINLFFECFACLVFNAASTRAPS